jgi:monothiol glutaredoxin
MCDGFRRSARGERAFELVGSNQNLQWHVRVIVPRFAFCNPKFHSGFAKFAGCGTMRADIYLMNKPKIIAYLKPTCGWSQGVRAVLKKYDLPYEDRDVINDPLQRQEMIEKSGQMLSPCVEINGQMLPDISGEEVEAWMLANNIVTPNDRVPDAPINQPCAHEMPQSAPLNFGRR